MCDNLKNLQTRGRIGGEIHSFKIKLFLFYCRLSLIFRAVMLLCMLILLTENVIASAIRDCIRSCFVMTLLVDGFVESATKSSIDAAEKRTPRVRNNIEL